MALGGKATFTQKFLTPAELKAKGLSVGGQAYDPDVSAITAASKTTQASAAVDRQKALQEISGAREKALGEFGNISPEVINQKTQEMMMGKARDTAEAERASMLRNLQNSYYTGSMPSGAAIQKASDIDLAKMGTLASARRDIMTNAAKTNWEGAFNLAGAKAGIQTGLTPLTVDTLGNTVATVPELGGKKPEAAKGPETYGRLPGEDNRDFHARDPEGYRKWFAAGQPSYKRI